MIIVTMVAIGVALATFMFAIFRIQERRMDKLEITVQELVKDVAEVKGSLATLHAGLRISVAEPPE